MLSTYFLIGFRNLLRHRYYTLLNIVGLAVGLACALLIWVFVRFESSFDSFHTQKEHLYRVVTEQRYTDYKDYQPGVPFPLPKTLQIDFPEVKVTQLFHSGGSQVTVLDEQKNLTRKIFKENSGIFYLEPKFFELFNFSFVKGSPQTSLSAPNQVVLTQAAAQQYFGDWKIAVGKFVQLDDKTLQVSGILQNPPANTDFPFKVLVSYATFEPPFDSWDSITSEFQCYVALPNNLSSARFNQMLAAFHKKHQPSQTINHQVLQPLADIHFSQEYPSFSNNNISRQALWLFSGIGVFLIIMACVNFVNLATALAASRAKEIGVRKVLGGNRAQLFGQLLTETSLIVLTATILAVVLIYLSFPGLKQIFRLPENLGLFSAEVFFFLVGTLVLVTLLAGFYPALVLSGYQPLRALKNNISSRVAGGISLRRALVVVQFSISQILIVGTILVVNQMHFVRTQDLGFQKEAIVFLRVDSDSLSKIRQKVLRAELLPHPNIQQVSYSLALPSDIDQNSGWGLDKFDNKTLPAYLEPQMKFADTAYFRTYNLQLLAGRHYQAADTLRELVVNETFLRQVGITNPEQALGKTIRFYGRPNLPIVGVVKDFHNGSLHSKISPIVMSTNADSYHTLSLKVSRQNLSQTLDFIRQRWQQTFPQLVFEYQFVDEKIGQYYEREEKMLRLFKAFAGVAIFIGCLGLFGLMAFTVQQRTKEVGIRKVLGATATSIVSLLSKDFLKLVLLANVIAWPLAGWVMQRWLQNFEYRTSMDWWVFGLGGALAVVITLVTVSFQAIKAALANPAEALRDE